MRNPRIITGAIGFVAASSMVLTGCGSSDSGSGGDDEYEVYALLPQGTDQPYGTTYLPPMKKMAKKENIDLTVTNAQYDAVQQASDCKVAVAVKPDLIILWPAVSDTVRPCVASAEAAGIPVTVTNSEVNPEDEDLIAGFSGPNTYGQGAASAEMMCGLADGKPTNIIMVNGESGNSTAINRREGFTDTIDEKCPNVEILAEQPGNWNKDDAQTVTSEMLTAVGAGKIDGLFAADDTMVAGSIAALKSRGIDPEPLYITSIGNTKLGNPLVKSGELDGTIYQSSSWDGRKAIELATQVLEEGEVEENLYMPSIKVTAENAGDPDMAPEW